MNRIVVGIAQYNIGRAPQKLVTYGLGSCVAVVLHSVEIGVGCMAHVMLPYAFDEVETGTPGKFADTAVAEMVRQMEARGTGPSRLSAKIAGGADMLAGQFKGPGASIGARNVLAVRSILETFGINLAAQDVGGTAGRTVEFTIETGLFMVRTLNGGVKEL